ncbi:hypothetical protein S7711_08387 [Stachybotrys chartarum IBT 7711]|uniref:cAMP-independent regulatory protein pac2 n=1 Tax=Stachybotrys chartarum (strain CBS 109288 / IBT 7711) TaxID=1280523 RepID=A0A084ARV0_STACB|nr:hypothetical protein S7711_08387 [Stachybotrys chartarum IBT 7711]KFA54080.1 hypothetical protein S40293_05520 [Stachybotrys chartarum IBT 40293]KFA76178.1 hypothetical protein S40288_04137 [Stachybotrys chartarum IBT 40288]
MMETYYGCVRTPGDAIKLFEACRLGLLPRVQRRLSEKERQSIRSGSVFVWDEREAGMRRWTDGKSWSASRVSGSFLTYREMEGKRGGGFGTGKRGAGKTPDSGRASDEDQDDGEPEGYRYKADGLMKQSFSITTSTGQHLHLISYYSRPQPGHADLTQPSTDSALRNIVPPKGMYPESSMGESNSTPALTRAPMQQAPFMLHPQQHPPSLQQSQQHQHPNGYAPSQPPSGYGWPPSPVATPPYAHYTTNPFPANGHHYGPPHPSQISPPQAPHSNSHAPPYDRAPLPPLQASRPANAAPHQSHYNVRSPPMHRHEFPHQQDLQAAAQAAAQAVMVDPRQGPHAGRSSQATLPALNAVTTGPGMASISAMSTPPTRPLSTSPPRSQYPEAISMPSSNKASLSALLHPATSGSDAAPAGLNSAGSSPRACGLAAVEKSGVSEDARALRMLDRKFCI